jgi:hypothetical protein
MSGDVLDWISVPDDSGDRAAYCAEGLEYFEY